MLKLAYWPSRMKTQSWLLLLACVVAQASSTVEENRRTDAPGQNIHKTGEPPAERTIFAVLSLIYMTVLSLLLGESPNLLLNTHGA